MEQGSVSMIFDGGRMAKFLYLQRPGCAVPWASNSDIGLEGIRYVGCRQSLEKIEGAEAEAGNFKADKQCNSRLAQQGKGPGEMEPVPGT